MTFSRYISNPLNVIFDGMRHGIGFGLFTIYDLLWFWGQIAFTPVWRPDNVLKLTASSHAEFKACVVKQTVCADAINAVMDELEELGGHVRTVITPEG